METAVDAGAVSGCPREGDRARVLWYAAGQSSRGDLLVRVLRVAAVLVKQQIRFRHRLAQLFSTRGGGERDRARGQQPRDATYGSSLRPLRLSSRARVR